MNNIIVEIKKGELTAEEVAIAIQNYLEDCALSDNTFNRPSLIVGYELKPKN